MANPPSHRQIATLLCSLHDHVREVIQSARAGGRILAGVVQVTKSDTLYRLDELAEEALLAWFSENWPESLPVELVMEGTSQRTFPNDVPVSATEWKCLIDPVDGTRSLMHDKRSAWILTGLARQRGPATSLRDIEVAAMTSLPTSREDVSDQVYAIREAGITASRFNLANGNCQPLQLHPSDAPDCRHGFATVTRFFPDGLALLGELEERLWAEVYPRGKGHSAEIFNDQYLCSGGQLYELLSGRDCFVADLRPLALRKLGIEASLTAHPYDLAACLIAEEAGVVLEDPLTHEPLDAPLDTTTPVSWVGYANEVIASEIRPVLRRLVNELLL